MKIYIGNDHTGIEMKNAISKYLVEQGHEVINIGTNTAEAVDYPDFGREVAQKTVADQGSIGIIICGSGIGISIAANKIKAARAALCYEEKAAELARLHNDANIIALGARFIAVEKAISLVDVFLKTDFDGERHQCRVDKLNEL
ncbi:ribose-5-phosphate isomerase B [Spiroplasma clarkii]|uniref:Ribose 5-phosphate isomerase B n=1 Tax=Spiroplasma clarkii TaxID=2139 RepID=A0A1Y0KYV9_9MOLU|nr:ribose 5-phosphate isomerase B [Spiroplasma clarkii]ARU90934.1 ribose-5-phosphate isomerase B [Spiroplasma clarkii]ATX70383.1 ribose 5-phosphate isomerase B [Spiroplasma clarkii]